MMAEIEAIEIRTMGAADLPQVLHLADALPEAPHWPPSAYLKAIDPKSTPRRIALVATKPESGSVLGFAIASLLPPVAELETIAIAPRKQRQGHATQLLYTLASQLKSAGAVELLLEVRSSNHPAITFYGSFGFAQTGLRPGYYAEPIEDAIQMRLRLP
jgi:[ribosomal protein S18]-alanine N-acetyltransferase